MMNTALCVRSGSRLLDLSPIGYWYFVPKTCHGLGGTGGYDDLSTLVT